MTDLSSDAVVLVTGANGFVGSRVCRHLAGTGVRVRALVRRADADLSEAGDVDVAVASLDDADALADALADVTHVVHCAAVAGPDLDVATAVNVAGTRGILEAAAAAGVQRAVHVSTTSVVDQTAQVVDRDARRVDDDANPYATTKRDAEDVAAQVAAATGLEVVVLRPPAVLGWGPSSTWGEKFPGWVAAGESPLRPDRLAPFGWVHVDDFAAAVALALTSDTAVGRTYVIAAGAATWGDYLDELVAWAEDGPDPYEPSATPPTPRTWPATAAREELGWSPTRSFRDAMDEIAAHHT